MRTISLPAIIADIRTRSRQIGPGELDALSEEAREAGSEATAWEELVELGEEIGRGWLSPLPSAELLSEMRGQALAEQRP
jgi:hypothetical protein